MNIFKNIALIVVSIISLPIAMIWEVVSRKEFIWLVIGIVIGINLELIW
jgi:sensor c-di-GMP phosphodiesterase-like protein